MGRAVFAVGSGGTMNIHELEKLATWYIRHFDQLNNRYQALIVPIQHNANQPTKQPFEAEMNTLLEYLNEIDFEVLSLQQIKMLEKLGVAQFIGRDGANFIENTIKTANFDPATGLASLNDAFSALSSARNQFDAYLQALTGLVLRHADTETTDDLITIRVGFQNDASIDNVTKWKDSAKDWYDIIRGLSVATNEAPESTQVVGASTGSIILILASVAAVTELLARISKHVTGVAKDSLEILHSMEDLRQKKILTTVMATEFTTMIETRKKKALDSILAEIKPLLPDESGDKIPALKASIQKLLEFNEKGGNVDFVAPDSAEVEAEAEAATEADGSKKKSAIAAAREAIQEYQEVREQLKLLSDNRPPDGK